MNKSYFIAAGIISTFVALPAIAGPDWQIIHDAEHQAASQEAQSGANQTVVLPLDHGPRALSTPWLNKEERLNEQNTTIKLSAHHGPTHG